MAKIPRCNSINNNTVINTVNNKAVITTTNNNNNNILIRQFVCRGRRYALQERERDKPSNIIIIIVI